MLLELLVFSHERKVKKKKTFFFKYQILLRLRLNFLVGLIGNIKILLILTYLAVYQILNIRIISYLDDCTS